MTEKVSLTGVLEAMDAYPEDKVLEAVSRMYGMSSNRGLFNSNFIPLIDIHTMGYSGLRRMLQNLYEIDTDFVLTNFGELRTIVIMLNNVDP
jgi:hypothetical protein